MRIHQLVTSVALVVACTTAPSEAVAAKDCWITGELKGKGAMASENYAFADDGIKDNVIICFSEKGGFVSGNDLTFVRFGESTLVGVAVNGLGLETVNTYQVDRQNHKVFYTATRIGTATLTGVLSDKVLALVGNAFPEPSEDRE